MFSKVLQLVTSVSASDLSSSGAISGYAILAVCITVCCFALQSFKPGFLENSESVDEEWHLGSLED
jgi:hypothetical protein